METLQRITKLVTIIAGLQILLLQNASAACSQDKGMDDDIAKLAAVLVERYKDQAPEQAKAIHADSPVKVEDGERFRLDRTMPIASQANAVGVFTDKPFNQRTKIGTSILISACHVLIPRHGFENDSNVHVSVGQSCEPGKSFKYNDIPGTVIADGGGVPKSGKDFKIVRIRPIRDIAPLFLTKESLPPSLKAMTIGFPQQEMLASPTGYRYPIARAGQAYGGRTDGTVVMENGGDNPGASGSALVSLSKTKDGQPRLRLGAMLTDNNGSGIATGKILSVLEKEHPAAYAELMAGMDGNCP